MRKNRTLRAGFLGTSTVMEMLEANYRTWCAQNNIAVEEGPAEVEAGREVIMDAAIDGNGDEDAEEVQAEEEQEEEWDGIMDVDDPDIPSFFRDELDEKARLLNSKSSSKRKRKGKVAELVREKVRKVLEDETELADKRARMCDEGDFLKLLWAFNKEGVHFS